MCFHCNRVPRCRPGLSRSDLFYVSTVPVVTQPEVCSKTHLPMFSMFLDKFSLSHFLLCFAPLCLSTSLLSSLFPCFSKTCGITIQFQNHWWDCIMWCSVRMLIGPSHWAFLLSLWCSKAIPLLLAVLPRVWMWFWLLCVGMWSVSSLLTFFGRDARGFFFFISHFSLSSARLCALKMISPWNAVKDPPLCSRSFISSYPQSLFISTAGPNGTT